MAGGKFDAELFKRALIAGAKANGLEPDEGKVQREAEKIAAMDARQQRGLLEKDYLRDFFSKRSGWKAAGLG